MRTTRVDDDHVARYENIGRKRYAFTVVHTTTGRVLASGVAEHEAGTPDGTIIATARRELAALDKRRRARSMAYARGEAVADAPLAKDVPPLQRAALDSPGGLEISAAMPVRIIRDAYNQIAWAVDREKRAIAIGREVLIGATDAQILKLARGEATLEGSLRTGVVYKELP